MLAQLSQGWQEVGRPAVNFAAKTFFAARLDLALAVGMSSVAPGGLGVALSRVLRLLVAARVARSQHGAGRAAAEDEDSDEGEAMGGGCLTSGGSAGAAQRAAESGQRAGTTSSPAPGAAGSPQPGPPAGPRRKRRLGPLPRGLGTAAPLPLPPLPPGALAECSVQPIGLPMMLVGQSAARAPMYASRGANRLMRGLLGLAATFLFTRWAPSSRQLPINVAHLPPGCCSTSAPASGSQLPLCSPIAGLQLSLGPA